ncbi:MAG: AraC family transcriptional regulator [Spirochaetales bacterium]|nr:AraC family transcriptional regulator [Spirochaetales bacterium]
MIEECYNSIQSDSDLNVTFTGREMCRPLHNFFGIRNHYVVHYIVKGEGILKINNKTYHLVPGCAFYIFPGQKNFYQAAKNNPWTYKWIGFVGSKADQTLALMNITRDNPVYSCEYSKEIDDLFDMLFYILKTCSNGFQIKVLGTFYLILTKFLDNAENIIIEDTNKKEDYIPTILKFIKINYQRNISVLQMANFLGLNRSYFSSLFKKKMNMNIQEYLIHYRIDKAKKMLSHTNYNISEIAFSIGYNDYYSFIKSFKKITGFTPKEYRKMHIIDAVQFME